MLAQIPRPGRSFSGLRRYLMQGAQQATHNPDRVAFVATRNLMTNDPERATRIMTATAALSVRVQRPVYHLVVSWHPDEQPSTDDMLAVAETTLEDIGLSEHQALIVGHRDTANRHMHLEINRVHPETGVAWDTSHDYRRVETSMRRQSEDMGFQAVPGKNTERVPALDVACRPKDGEYHLVRRQGRTSLPTWSKAVSRELGRVLKPAFDNAKSWNDLTAELAKNGAFLVPKGQGFVLTNATRAGTAKLSALGANVRAKDLVARLGPYGRDMAQVTTQAERAASQGRPVVSKVDIVLAMHGLGLANRETLDDQQCQLAEQAPELSIDRERRAALKAAVGTPPRSQRRRSQAHTRSDDHEPRP